MINCSCVNSSLVPLVRLTFIILKYCSVISVIVLRNDNAFLVLGYRVLVVLSLSKVVCFYLLCFMLAKIATTVAITGLERVPKRFLLCIG